MEDVRLKTENVQRTVTPARFIERFSSKFFQSTEVNSFEGRRIRKRCAVPLPRDRPDLSSGYRIVLCSDESKEYIML